MEKELLQDLKNYLDSDYSGCNDSALLFCIKRAMISFKNKRNYPKSYSEDMINEDIKKHYACVFDLALYWYNKQGLEFQSSHSESGISRLWQKESEIYMLHNIIPIARII